MFAHSLADLLERVEREGQGRLEFRGRLFEADRATLRARFAMGDGLEGSVAVPWPAAAASAEDARAQLLRRLNALVQRCGMFETCERAYQTVYGKRPA